MGRQSTDQFDPIVLLGIVGNKPDQRRLVKLPVLLFARGAEQDLQKRLGRYLTLLLLGFDICQRRFGGRSELLVQIKRLHQQKPALGVGTTAGHVAATPGRCVGIVFGPEITAGNGQSELGLGRGGQRPRAIQRLEGLGGDPHFIGTERGHQAQLRQQRFLVGRPVPNRLGLLQLGQSRAVGLGLDGRLRRLQGLGDFRSHRVGFLRRIGGCHRLSDRLQTDCDHGAREEECG